ncbi:hypothetical protein QFC19_005836 [Naganishia cerealis]|uniref:Uncharacterized protein n=1 Tax=Naganishia cerealis TaxID=610337 RepID=A0ACC2VLG7_9TREE|nr:hypothetical protein QFC19_005836 [Naganishia cerealis]
MADTFSPAALKKRRNAKGLQLSSKSLAPLPVRDGTSTSGSHPSSTNPGLIQDALSDFINMNQATPTVSSASRGDADEEKILTPTQATLGDVGAPSRLRISRKKPMDLDITKSLGVRKAPLHPGATDDLESKLTSMQMGEGNVSSTTSKPSLRPSALSVPDASTPVPKSSSSSSSRTGTKKKKPTSSSGPKEKDVLEAGPFGELKNDEFKVVGDLGAGAGGTVDKVIHVPTGTVMAKKLVLIDAKPAVRKQILRELQIMHGCSSPFIVSFYVGKIAEAVLEGLTYLYDVHRIIHRDIKPSNILVNSKGSIKICDFGVSGELINSIANTFVGTSTYMSPERIQGGNYSVKSDVWSLGISLIELALGRFPFSNNDNAANGSGHNGDDDSDLPDQLRATAKASRSPPVLPAVGSGGGGGGKSSKPNAGPNMSILDLLQYIVNEPAPRLTPSGKYPREAELFIDDCLQKDPGLRKNPKELLVSASLV